MEMLEHEHPLSLIDLNPEYPHEKEVYDDEEDLIAKQAFQHPCDRCSNEITYLHRYYYKCDQCDYSLHQLCGELPTTLKHASHSEHTLTLFLNESHKGCHMCKSTIEDKKLKYHCSRCMFNICLDCSMDMKQYHTIYHPSHQHPLVPTCKEFMGECDACGYEHKGIFYQCITCFGYDIHNDCAFQAKRLLIQDSTHGHFFHTHPLILTYSFPIQDQKTKYNPGCRVCDDSFSDIENRWLFKCEICRYYVHINCVTSRWKSFKSSDSDLDIRSGNPSTSYPLSDRTLCIIKDTVFKESNEMILTHSSHQHPLIWVDTPRDITTVKEVCNGCCRPILMDMPYYKCTSFGCNFVLHSYCTRLPTELKLGHNNCHPQHTLILLLKLALFECASCGADFFAFAYFCVECKYYLDVRCAFFPLKITHKSHPRHLLSIVGERSKKDYCRICLSGFTYDNKNSYSCKICSFHLHPECALLLPETIRHKYDKHPMTLSYSPVENHEGDYFCEVCEEEFNPNASFYHCHECVQSIHTACAPITIPLAQTKQFVSSFLTLTEVTSYKFSKRRFLKRGPANSIYHTHPLSIVKETSDQSDGSCTQCGRRMMRRQLYFKCLDCEFLICYGCAAYCANIYL